MKKILLSSVALLGFTAGAMAADLPRRAAPPAYFAPVPVFTWTGFYVGVNAGYAWNNSDNGDCFGCNALTVDTPAFLLGSSAPVVPLGGGILGLGAGAAAVATAGRGASRSATTISSRRGRASSLVSRPTSSGSAVTTATAASSEAGSRPFPRCRLPKGSLLASPPRSYPAVTISSCSATATTAPVAATGGGRLVSVSATRSTVP